MKILLKTNRKIRYALCLLLPAVSILAAGAGKMNAEVQSRAKLADESRKACRNAVMGYAAAIPSENRAGWRQLAADKPELCLRATHYALSRSAQ